MVQTSIGQASGHGGGYGPPMSERSVATWEPLPSLCALGMLYTITRYRDTTYYSEWPKVAGAVIKARSRARHPHTVVLSLVRFSPSGAEELS